jgi:ankyrin repeat protein
LLSLVTAVKGATDLVLLLLHRGADLEVANNENEIASDIAIALSQDSCTATLLRTKYELLDGRSNLLSSLHYAAMAADMIIFRRLADNGFSFREVDGYGATSSTRSSMAPRIFSVKLYHHVPVFSSLIPDSSVCSILRFH